MAAAQCGLRIFGRRADDSPATPSQATSREGGRGVYLPPEHVAELPAILDALLGPQEMEWEEIRRPFLMYGGDER